MNEFSLRDFSELAASREQSRAPVWDALWGRRSIGRLAVQVTADPEWIEEAQRIVAAMPLAEPSSQPPGWTEEWRKSVQNDLAVGEIPLWNDLCRAAGAEWNSVGLK
ncbi:MAG: hypothetical protein HY360_08090 [Verrucomicrobia bacterium]|nr:hypothetical protein [Verrucomicrobiota bacterium]